MANSISPNSVIIENFGDTTLHIATFTGGSVNNESAADTWASGIQGVQGFWFQGTDDTTTATMNAVDISESSGTFTFLSEEKDREGRLFVMSQT